MAPSSQMTDIAPLLVVVGIEGGTDEFDQRAVRAAGALAGYSLLVLAPDLRDTLGLLQFLQALAGAPGEALAASLGLIGLRLGKTVGMVFPQAYPFMSPLEEAKGAAAALPPLVIGRQPQAACF